MPHPKIPIKTSKKAPAGIARLIGILPRTTPYPPYKKRRLQRMVRRMAVRREVSLALRALSGSTPCLLNIFLADSPMMAKFAINQLGKRYRSQVGHWPGRYREEIYSAKPRYGTITVNTINMNRARFVLGFRGTSIPHFLSYLAVLSPEKQQRVAVAHHHIFDFRNKDGVIAGLFGRVQAAFQVGQRAIEHRGPVPGAVKTCARLGLGVLVRAIRARVVLRNCSLVLAQHIDAETLFRVQVFMGARLLVDADQ